MRDKPIPKELISEWLRYAPMVTSNLIVYYKGDIVMVKRKHNPLKGEWFTPGGIITKSDEHFKERVYEIFRDETGLTGVIPKLEFLMVANERFDEGYNTETIQLISLIYYVILGDEMGDITLNTNDDHSDIRWVPLTEVSERTKHNRNLDYWIHKFLERELG